MALVDLTAANALNTLMTTRQYFATPKAWKAVQQQRYACAAATAFGSA